MKNSTVELVSMMVKSLVDNPEKVDVKEISGEKSTILELRISELDRGKVIGKQGRIIKAIRTIVNAAGMKVGRKINIEIIE